jgi:hypothetical protein
MTPHFAVQAGHQQKQQKQSHDFPKETHAFDLDTLKVSLSRNLGLSWYLGLCHSNRLRR